MRFYGVFLFAFKTLMRENDRLLGARTWYLVFIFINQTISKRDPALSFAVHLHRRRCAILLYNFCNNTGNTVEIHFPQSVRFAIFQPLTLLLAEPAAAAAAVGLNYRSDSFGAIRRPSRIERTRPKRASALIKHITPLRGW